MTKTDLNTTELAEKILAGEVLTDSERQQASLLLRFEGMGESALLTAREYGAGSVILSGYAEGADSEAGDPPLFAVIGLHEPDAQTWAAVSAALDDEATGPDELLARLRALPQEWRDKANRAGGGFGNGLHDAANMLEAALSGEADCPHEWQEVLVTELKAGDRVKSGSTILTVRAITDGAYPNELVIQWMENLPHTRIDRMVKRLVWTPAHS